MAPLVNVNNCEGGAAKIDIYPTAVYDISTSSQIALFISAGMFYLLSKLVDICNVERESLCIIHYLH